MIMGADELEKKIQRNIKSQLSHKDLMHLCSILKIQISGRKTYIQDKLIDSVKTMSTHQRIIVSNQIDEYIKLANNKTRQIIPPKPAENCRYEPNPYPPNNERLTETLLRNAPVNLESEIPIYCRNDLVAPPKLPYHNNMTNLPMSERDLKFRFPNILQSVQLARSPFYCSAICLHPLSLLIPTHEPSSIQTSRNMNKFPLTFILTENVKQILAANQYTVNGKTDYKWQVLLRFTSIDPNVGLPNGDNKVAEYIPPYLQVSVNNSQLTLWDILPSNCRTKEGKRHAKPVPISDKLTEKARENFGWKQTIEISWWQTPGVFMYYYVGIYLERKMSVKEMMVPFVSNHFNKSIDETIKMIQSKLGDASKNKRRDNDDDDLVISNVLPINLCCPVGKSRIEIPLRTVTCQHLQCFDAYLFLSMNERRPVWKCPVCDNRATPIDLFCDKFFEKILVHFKNDDEVTDVNVHPDNSFVAVKRSKDRSDREINERAIVTESVAPTQKPVEQDLIVLDSDEEIEVDAPVVRQTTPVSSIIESNEDSDMRSSVINKPSSSSVQINICSDDANIREIERRITPDINYADTPSAPMLSTESIAPSPVITPQTNNATLTTPFNKSPSIIPPLTSPYKASPNLSNGNLPPVDSSSSPPRFQPPLLNKSMPPLVGQPWISTNKVSHTSLSTSLAANNPQTNKSTTFKPSSKTSQANNQEPEMPPLTPNHLSKPKESNQSTHILTATSHPKSLPLSNNRKSPNSSQSSSTKLKNTNLNSNLPKLDSPVDIVKTLTIDVPPVVQHQSERAQSPEPIVCPNITFSESENKKTSKTILNDMDTSSLAPSIENNKSEPPKPKSRMTMSKMPPPPSAVAIPSVTIDLTEDDEDSGLIAQTTNTASISTPSIRLKNQYVPNLLKKDLHWMQVKAPISNLKPNQNGINTKNIGIPNRYTFGDKTKRSLDPSVNHFKPHQMKHINANNNNNPIKNHQPIDLTGEDEDEDCTPPKRSRTSNSKSKRDTEEGEVNDSESCSSSGSLLRNIRGM